MGNPPFLGSTYQTKEQKETLINCFGKKVKGVGNLDYVTAWFIKSARYIQNTNIQCGFVATNSISQGEIVSTLWAEMYKYNITINFAYTSFAWSNGTSSEANVYCVIVGFSTIQNKDKFIFDAKQIKKVNNINPYLVDGDNILIEKSSKPIYNISKMVYGSKPIDGGHLSKYTEDEMNEVIVKYPKSKELFRPLVGGDEFINNKKRYCIWLKDIPPQKYIKIPYIMDKIKMVKELRLQSKKLATQKCAETPYLFGEIRQPNSDYLVIPEVSSEKRKYIPIGYMTKDIIANNLVQTVQNATLYEFGILTSNIHMAWVKTVCGKCFE